MGKSEIKVLGIMCSPRKGGNTQVMLEEVIRGAAEEGAGTDFFHVVGKDIKPCDHCQACVQTAECSIKDDMQGLYKMMLEANAIVIGTPVYFFNVTAQAKIIMDRTYNFVLHGKLANKCAGAVMPGTVMGYSSAWNALINYFFLQRMNIVDVAAGFAKEKGDIRKDRHAMLSAKELGRLMVSVCKNQGVFSEEHTVPLFRYVDDKYGIERCPVGSSLHRRKRFESAYAEE
ncbi:flavodoxin family protein [Chloroflexota bacterium]